MKHVFIVSNAMPEKVFKTEKAAESYLQENGYVKRKGFYCLNGESDTEWDLMINKFKVEE